MSISKRKREVEGEDLEIDLDAPEPPSKKALRKAKKVKSQDHAVPKLVNTPTTDATNDEEVVSNRGARSQYGIWIGNLSFTTTKKDLLDFLSSDIDYAIDQAQITRINLPMANARNGKSQNKGFAYVDLTDNSSLTKALELSEKLLGGRRVLIKNAKSFEGRPAEVNNKKAVDGKPPSRRIFLGNLSFDTTTEDLEKHFEVCGAIRHTKVATFEDSGKCKGYAWIEFEDISSAQAAMRGWVEQSRNSNVSMGPKKRIWLHKIDGRKLRLEYAEDPTTRYNKRYGKNADQPTTSEVAIQEVDESAPRTEKKEKVFRKTSEVGYPKSKRGGYQEDTVKRLTGAIVEAKGQKISFD